MHVVPFNVRNEPSLRFFWEEMIKHLLLDYTGIMWLYRNIYQHLPLLAKYYSSY